MSGVFNSPESLAIGTTGFNGEFFISTTLNTEDDSLNTLYLATATLAEGNFDPSANFAYTFFFSLQRGEGDYQVATFMLNHNLEAFGGSDAKAIGQYAVMKMDTSPALETITSEDATSLLNGDVGVVEWRGIILQAANGDLSDNFDVSNERFLLDLRTTSLSSENSLPFKFERNDVSGGAAIIEQMRVGAATMEVAVGFNDFDAADQSMVVSGSTFAMIEEPLPEEGAYTLSILVAVTAGILIYVFLS